MGAALQFSPSAHLLQVRAQAAGLFRCNGEHGPEHGVHEPVVASKFLEGSRCLVDFQSMCPDRYGTATGIRVAGR